MKYTLLLIIWFWIFFNSISTLSAQEEKITNQVYLFDFYNNWTITHENDIQKGSKIYGYFYKNGSSNTLSPQDFTLTIPTGSCMTSEWLPIILPKNSHKSNLNTTTTETSNTYKFTIEDLITDTTSSTDKELNPIKTITNIYNYKHIDQIDRIKYETKDGQEIYTNGKQKSPFSFSIDNWKNWIEYLNRNEEHIPNDCSITDIKVTTTASETPIFTYNIIVTDENVNTFNPEWPSTLTTEWIDDGLITKLERGTPASLSYNQKTIFSEQCSTLPINISIKEKEQDNEEKKEEEKPKENNPTPPIIQEKPKEPVPTNSISGPGGYVPVKPTEISKTITPKIENTNPNLSLQCQNIVKNLDDIRLLEYYKTLQVKTESNVNDNISRLELVRLMINAGYLNVNTTEDISILDNFADVAKNSWYAPYVAKLIKKDIISLNELTHDNKEANSLKLFNTYGNITREDAIKILSSIITENNLRLPTLDEILAFSDVKNTDKNADYIQYAYNTCLVHGRNTIDGNPIDWKPRVFEGKSNITVAEVSKILFNGQDIK